MTLYRRGQTLIIPKQMVRHHHKQACPSHGMLYCTIFRHSAKQVLGDLPPQRQSEGRGVSILPRSSVPQDKLSDGFYLHIFTRKKPSGKHRLILNLKPLNKKMKCKKFWMESIYSVRNLLLPWVFMATVDLLDAYLYTYQKGKITTMTRNHSAFPVHLCDFRHFFSTQNFHQNPGRSSEELD